MYTESSLPARKYEDTRPSTANAVAHSQVVKTELGQPQVAASGASVSNTSHRVDALTEAHVFERLNIKACGEQVLAYIEPDTPSAVKSESIDGEGSPAKSAEATGGSWCEARLLKLSLPKAEVEITVEEKRKILLVNVDELRALSKIVPVRVVLHPTLQDPGFMFDQYDYDAGEKAFLRQVALHAIDWAHLPIQSAVEGVRVSMISEQGKLPMTLQLRALTPFKKGALVLSPSGGQLIAKEKTDDPQAAPSQGVIHEAMLTEVDVTVISKFGTVKRDPDNSKDTAFVLRSPLLGGKAVKNRESCLENLPPFWALLRTAGPRAQHNMELTTENFRDGGIDIKGASYPKLGRGVEFFTSFPVARNSSHIAKGEVLCLPFKHS